MRALAYGVLVAVTLLLSAPPGQAQITRLAIERTEPLGLDGYERLTGHAYGWLDPAHPLNVIITDLGLAPKNTRGMVEYAATFTMLKPIDMANASGVLLYFVANRGNIDLVRDQFLVDARKAGHVIVASGWQGDLEPADGRETLAVPVARNPDGSSITGPVLARISDIAAGETTATILRGGAVGTADPAELDTHHARLTRRPSEAGPVIPVPSSEWAFADCSRAAFPGVPDPRKLCLKHGFDPGYLYELVYTAKDPEVLGIGFAATRDLIAHLRHGERANPLEGQIRSAVSFGNSQSGTYLRQFINLGFNQDLSGRIVFDGSNPNIAARLLAMNIRFGAPSAGALMYDPGSEGVVWWSREVDVARGRPAAGILDRCTATDTCPKIVETFGSAEFYNQRASPTLVGTGADRDIPLPSNVRRYVFPGVRHGGGPGGFDAAPPATNCCALISNPNSSDESLRALRTALVAWVVDGTLPPPSQYPRLDRGELVPPTQAALGFPTIPGVPLPDGILNPLYDYDFGDEFDYADVSGVITIQPPPIRRVLPTLVPKVNADGNEIAGVASVLHQVPLGTYTGWNIVPSGFFKGRILTNGGSFIPFARTRAERLARGDPRLSLEERYGTHARYVELVRGAAERLVQGRYLLQDDADRLIAEAEASAVLK
jgi:hypothetical protein